MPLLDPAALANRDLQMHPGICEGVRLHIEKAECADEDDAEQNSDESQAIGLGSRTHFSDIVFESQRARVGLDFKRLGLRLRRGGLGLRRCGLGLRSAERSVSQSVLKFGDQVLPNVTASIGVASTPPDSRNRELESVADARQGVAKTQGKDRVVSA